MHNTVYEVIIYEAINKLELITLKIIYFKNINNKYIVVIVINMMIEIISNTILHLVLCDEHIDINGIMIFNIISTNGILIITTNQSSFMSK